MSDGEFFSDTVEVRRVRRRTSRRAARAALWLVLVPVIAGMALGLWSVLFGTTLAMWQPWMKLSVVSWLGAAPIAALVSLWASLQKKLRIRTVSVRGGELRLEGDGTRRIAAEEVEGAMVLEQHEGESEAEIALRSGEVLLVRSGGGGPELVKSLGFTGAKRRTAVALGGPRRALWSAIGGPLVGGLAAIVSTCGVGTTAAAMHLPFDSMMQLLLFTTGSVFLGATLLAARMWAPSRLVFGGDGVLVEGAFRKRFFRRSEIVGVHEIHGGAALLVGKRDRVREVRLTAERGARQAALIERIREALAEHGEDSEPRAELLARGGDSLEGWRERLRKLVAKGEGYRASPLPADVLVRTVADAQAPADVRVGAALAIALSGDEAAKQQLRIAQGAIASEKLRVAVEAAGEGLAEEEAIAAACEEAGTWSTGRR